MTFSFEPEKTYRLKYHASADNCLFNSDESYIHFLKCFTETMLPLLNTYAYCLLPKEFSYLVEVKSEKEIFDFLKHENRIPEEQLNFSSYKELSDTAAPQIGNMFALQVTKQFHGFIHQANGLLSKTTSPKIKINASSVQKESIESNEAFIETIIDIHNKPCEMGLSELPEKWKFSSYSAYLSDKPSAIKRDKALNLLNDKIGFRAAHSQSNFHKISEESSTVKAGI